MQADQEASAAEAQVHPFTTRAEFNDYVQQCLARATHTLQLFDPDFALWNLGGTAADAALRRFLGGQGRLRLVAHSNAELERHAPRFLRLLKDFSHLIECRLTPQGLRQLSDSFCVADGVHIVRRYHADHMRGVAAFQTRFDTKLSIDRFDAIWLESNPGLHASTTGL
ncbi:hypothetical protein [Rugamonas sp.]|uniref:DUF7931 domain-containing protein n=1 Tax=Rugamonas sp. TaxID=1926287 RepID=UPI0025E86059|nr:hypothetical protein [Rugamonas sp.]